MKLIRGVGLVCVSAVVTACSVGPDYKRPPVDAAPIYKEQDGWKPTEPADAMTRGPWWHIFNDEVLGGLEDQIDISNRIVKSSPNFNLTPAQLKLKSNTRQIAYPRQIAMFLVKELTQASLPEIGRYFGGKHHTTVLHSVQKIGELRNHEEDLNKLILSLIDSLQQG